MIGQLAIAVALPGFSNFGKMNKKSMWEVKKVQDFCPRDIESYHLAAARQVKLWLLNMNLFFKEPHQLTNFT